MMEGSHNSQSHEKVTGLRIGIEGRAAVIPPRTGIGNYVYHLLHSFDRMQSYDSFYAYFRHLPDGAASRWVRNLKRVRFASFPGRGWMTLRLPVRMLLDGIQVAHFTWWNMPPICTGRTVLTIHDLSFERGPEWYVPEQARIHQCYRRWVQRADHLIAVSEFTKRELMELYQTPGDKISVTPEAAGDQFHPTPAPGENPNRPLGLPRGYILAVGTLQPRKNYTRLIDAYRIVVDRMPSAPQLVIAGAEGWLCDHVLEKAYHLQLAGNLILLGYVSDDFLPALYRGAGIFVFPSLYEGFGLPVLEAMQTGVPVICSNTSSLPEVAGDAALLVDPTETEQIALAIHKVLTDESMREDLSARGLAQAARFSWEKTACLTLQVYHRVAK